MTESKRQIPFINLQEQYQNYKSEIQIEINKILDSSSYIMGPEIRELEEELAEYVGRKHCLSCSSGTDALQLILMALNIGPGDQIIVPAFTFFATAEVVNIVGATPVFADVLTDTYTLDPQSVKAAITDKTKAIIPVSLFGQTYEHEEIGKIAAEAGIPVIEDGAQSFGATSKGIKSMNFGIAGCTSFFPAKPLGAYGDGGAVFVDDDELFNRLQSLRNHGQTERYIHGLIGMNGRLDSLQAAVLLVKLRHYEEDLKARKVLSTRYFNGLKKNKKTILPHIKEGNVSVFAQFTIQVDNRMSFLNWMNQYNIPVAVHYPRPLYRQPVYKTMRINSEHYPVSEKISKHVVSLPFSPFLSEEDQNYIIKIIDKWENKN